MKLTYKNRGKDSEQADTNRLLRFGEKRPYAALGIYKFLCGVALLSSVLLPRVVEAQEDDNAGVDVELVLVSNYVWRGEDIFADKAAQNKEVPGAHTGEWAFQPSITFYTPTDGLYFNIWLSYALASRADKDIDGIDECDADPGTEAPDCEENGLARSDEIDYTIGYESESRIGTVGFGLVSYSYPNPKGKGPSDTELFFSYSPAGPIASNLYVNIASSFGGGDEEYDYYQIGYGHAFGLSDDMELELDIAAGYQVQQGLSAWKDYTGSVGLAMYNFHFGFNMVVRGSPHFYDTDDDNGGDFKVAHPTSGELEALPRTLWWLSLAYSMSL